MCVDAQTVFLHARARVCTNARECARTLSLCRVTMVFAKDLRRLTSLALDFCLCFALFGSFARSRSRSLAISSAVSHQSPPPSHTNLSAPPILTPSLLFSLSDLTLMVDGRKIYVHRAILYSRSKHFGNMFTSGMRECEERIVVINDAPYASFKVAL